MRPALGTSSSWTPSPQAGSPGAVRVLKPSPPSRAGATLVAEMLKTLGSCPWPAPGLQRLCALRGRCPGSGRCAPANLGRLAQSAPRDGLVIPGGFGLLLAAQLGKGKGGTAPTGQQVPSLTSGCPPQEERVEGKRAASQRLRSHLLRLLSCLKCSGERRAAVLKALCGRHRATLYLWSNRGTFVRKRKNP